MKKVLLSLTLGLVSLGVFAQSEVSATIKNSINTNPAAALLNTQAVNDTISGLIFSQQCNPGIRVYSSPSFGYITGTSKTKITEVGHFLNYDSVDVDVYSLLAVVLNKKQGNNKGSFVGKVYNSDANLYPDQVLGTTQSVTFDNVDTAGVSYTEFPFANPVAMGSNGFFATIQVDNGSDTIAIGSTGPACGGFFAVYQDTGGWKDYGSQFSSNGAPLDIIVYVFATVDAKNIGLESNLISRSGLKTYPNPATDELNIEFDMPNESKVSLRVEDMMGRVVYSTSEDFNASDRKFTVDLSEFSNGTYTYQVIGSKTQLNGVFVKH